MMFYKLTKIILHLITEEVLCGIDFLILSKH